MGDDGNGNGAGEHVTLEMTRTAVNVCLVVVAAVCLQNVARHYWSHSSFAGSIICVDPTLRHTISFADDHCREHEVAADLTSIGGVLFSIIAVNLHIISTLALVAIVAFNQYRNFVDGHAQNSTCCSPSKPAPPIVKYRNVPHSLQQSTKNATA